MSETTKTNEMPVIEIAQGMSARLGVTSAEGLPLAFDGVLRYLATRPAETVQAIAALVKLLPAQNARLSGHEEAWFRLVRSLDGAKVKHMPPEGEWAWHLYDASLAIGDDFTVQALYSREAPLPDVEAP